MNTIGKRDFLKAVGGTAVGVSLSGCLGDSDDADLTFWWISAETEDWQDYVEWFEETLEEEYDLTVEQTEQSYSDMRQNFLTGGSGGTPDAIEGVIEHPGDYVAADLLEPLTEHTDRFDHFDGFVDSTVEAFRFQDELWALPYTGNGRALVYNSEVLDEYGYESPPEELDEFMEVASAIYEGEDMNGFHLTTERGEVRATQEFLSHVYQLTDGRLYEWDGDGWELQASADDFGVVLAEIYYEMFHGENQTVGTEYRGSGWETNDTGYTERDHAMIHCGPWVSEFQDTDVQAETIEQTRISLLPRPAGGSDATYLEVKPVMVNQHSDSVDEALDLIDLFSSPESIQQMKEATPAGMETPVHEDVEPSIEHEGFEGFVDAFENGVAPAPIAWGRVREPIYDAIEETIYEEQDPEDAAESLVTELEETDVALDPDA